MLDEKSSLVKDTYFKDLKVITSEDVKRVFISLDDAPDLDVVKIGIIYLITSYLFATSYLKVVDQYIFALVDDFATLETFPWGRYLFETTLSSLRKGLSKQTSHYRLTSFLVAFQVWLYECIPALEGNVAIRICKKYPRIINWTVHKYPSAAMLEDKVFGSENVVINDIDPSEVELTMPYMTYVQYSKPRQPTRNVRISKNQLGTSEATPLLSKVHVEDSDFVDPPLYKQTGAAGSSSRDQQSAAYHSDCSCFEECGRLKQLIDKEITKLQAENKGLKEELMSMKSELSKINVNMRQSNNSLKLNEVIQSHNVLKDSLSDIRLSLKIFVESVSDILSSVIDELHKKLSGKDVLTEQVPKDDDDVDKKGKGHMEPEPKGDDVAEKSDNVHIEPEQKGDDVVEKVDKGHMTPKFSHVLDDYVLESPSFDLGVGSSHTPKSSDDTFFASKEVRDQVNEAIARVLESTELHSKDEDTPAPPSFGLPVKRAQKPSKTLQSPFVKVEPRHAATGSKSNTVNVVFQNYSKGVDSTDLSSFKNWFDKGYKPKNKVKFNDADNVISPQFVCGTVTVHYKTWWHMLIDSNSSLKNTHLDACFHYIRQLAKFGEGVKMKATTTDYIFDMSIKLTYSKFIQDPSIVEKNDELIKTINGQLDITNHVLYIYNSSNKSYKDNKVHEGVLSLVKTLTHLLKFVGLWKKTSDSIGDKFGELRVNIVRGLPPTTKWYAQYLLHNNLGNKPMSFDAGNARLEIAALLFKNKQLKQIGKGSSKSCENTAQSKQVTNNHIRVMCYITAGHKCLTFIVDTLTKEESIELVPYSGR
ncbi:uncharacterized protein LOC111384983 [Olea europaea var. sylvestris]|uniref:uncharacterized protein LOC111384983 n=1 Tax=Olea europaea var. sylvestris TaxID=158386 RepID=UPI000C1D5E52|nr:uncharacterized protein LOC111384983 [Olea europaea var. sylvestris]